MKDIPLIHEFLTPQRRGVVALPAALRERLHLDVPGAQLEIVEHADGTFEIRGALPVDANQQWFWTERWQQMEREADDDVGAGRTALFSTVDSFLDDLDG